MGRRGKSKDVAIFEALCGGAAFAVLLWLFSPEFRLLVKVVLATVVFILVAGVLFWLIIKEFKNVPAKSCSEPQPTNFYPPDCTLNSEQPSNAKESKNNRPVSELSSSAKLRKLDWFQFEKLIEHIYKYRGFSVKRLGGANPDGGVDLIVESPTDKFVIQCKHWRKWTVGVRQIREFLGTLTDSGISKGIFVTLVGYSDEAKQLADKHCIQILNESDLVRMMEESGLMYASEISNLFSDTKKYCPKCENEMILRTSRANGNKFWGCSRYPRCNCKLKYEC